MSYDHLYDMYYDEFEDDDDVYGDPICGICGFSYCPCCGCNCWMDDVFEEDIEE